MLYPILLAATVSFPSAPQDGGPTEVQKAERAEEAAAEVNPRVKAAEVLGAPLAKETEVEARLEVQRGRAGEAAALLPEDSEIRRVLLEAVEASRKAPGSEGYMDGKGFERRLKEARKDLAFKPIIQSKMPKGFPAPVPTGEIQVQQYPAYRLARTKMRGGQNGAFFTLFDHIKSNDIAMTAPVEMTVDEGNFVDMAFLYRDPELGEVLEGGMVEVQDIDAMTVLSMGVRGNSRSQRVKTAQQDLERWLKEHKGTWRAAGKPRIMGYNSPMIPRSRQFSEVQIPVVKVKPKAAPKPGAEPAPKGAPAAGPRANPKESGGK